MEPGMNNFGPFLFKYTSDLYTDWLLPVEVSRLDKCLDFDPYFNPSEIKRDREETINVLNTFIWWIYIDSTSK